jgi:DNA polymerase III subunit delta'
MAQTTAKPAAVFADLVGQDHVVEVLQQAVTDPQAMTHAWLFTGPPGSGRSVAATAFARALTCREGGCGECQACRITLSGGNADVEIVRTEGLSIKVDEVRELVARSAWAPSGSKWRVVILEDADRLTETAGNALLKAIEEPGVHTVWLLCAPAIDDVLPTIRSRCRHLALRTPTTDAVAGVLINRFQVDPAMAMYAARASQGHIGRARWLATDEDARTRRRETMLLPAQLNNIGSCMSAAADLVASATDEAKRISADRDGVEMETLQRAWGHGATGKGLPSGASKAFKDLEREQKSRATRATRDAIDRALIDLSTFYRDVLVIQQEAVVDLINEDHRPDLDALARRTSSESTLKRLEAIIEAREAIQANVAPLLAIEAMMLALRT